MSAIDSFTMIRNAAPVGGIGEREATRSVTLPAVLAIIAGIGLLVTLCEITAGVDLSAALSVMQ
jgi:hypothetical protein